METTVKPLFWLFLEPLLKLVRKDAVGTRRSQGKHIPGGGDGLRFRAGTRSERYLPQSRDLTGAAGEQADIRSWRCASKKQNPGETGPDIGKCISTSGLKKESNGSRLTVNNPPERVA
jgi:hypothetical protein